MNRHDKAKPQFDNYLKQSIESGRKLAEVSERAQKASQRATSGAKATDEAARRKTARQGL